MDGLAGKKVKLAILDDFYNKNIDKIEDVVIQEFAGEGGFGVVFRVKSGSKDFALKTFNSVNLKSKQYECYLHAFKKEFKASQRIDHPNVTNVHQFGRCRIDTLTSRPYILSDFAHGENLDELWDRELDRFEIATQIIKGLDVIHKTGIVHRDIKPDNIIVDNNFAKILDFGICYFTIATTELITKTLIKETGQTIFAYKAPELWELFKSEWDVKLDPDPYIPQLDKPIPASDVFALGVVLYRLFCKGQMPYARTDYEILPTLLNRDFNVTPPREINSEIPQLWNDLVMRCLNRSLNNRFKDASEVLKYLNESTICVETIQNRKNLLKKDLEYLSDFRGAELIGVDLSERYLHSADLSLANLILADLREADLREADLSLANLSSANLRGADLSSANLSSANLRGADLSSAYLSSANLREADLREANLREADLILADLSGEAILSGADLRGADLSGANLRKAKLSEVKNLTPQQLSQCKNVGDIRGLSNDFLREVRKLNPKLMEWWKDPEADLYFENGNEHFNMKEYEKAIADYSKAIELDPNDAHAYDNRGVCYSDLKEYEKALADLNTAIELYPNYANPYYNLSCLYSLQNDIDKALKHLEESLSKGFDKQELINSDPELENLRKHPKFQPLMDKYFKKD